MRAVMVVIIAVAGMRICMWTVMIALLSKNRLSAYQEQYVCRRGIKGQHTSARVQGTEDKSATYGSNQDI